MVYEEEEEEEGGDKRRINTSTPRPDDAAQ
jgi:hypothetical protein